MPPTTGEPTAVVDPAAPDRVLTVPNLLSLLRLLGVPLFLWLLLGPHADLAALGVLAFAGASDWLDGKLARLLHQTSRLGTLLDPAADRLYILSTLTAFGLRDIIPWWLAGVIVGRDLLLGGCLLVLRRYGYGPPQVHYLGKAATFNLLYAFPLLLLGAGTNTIADIARPIGWAFTVWGTALYFWAGLLYVYQVGRLVRDARGGPRPTPDAPATATANAPGTAAVPGATDATSAAGTHGMSGAAGSAGPAGTARTSAATGAGVRPGAPSTPSTAGPPSPPSPPGRSGSAGTTVTPSTPSTSPSAGTSGLTGTPSTSGLTGTTGTPAAAGTADLPGTGAAGPGGGPGTAGAGGPEGRVTAG